MGFSAVAKVAVFVVIAGAGFAGGMTAAPVFGVEPAQDRGAEPVVTVDTTLVKNSFADIGELATESYNFTQVGKYSEEGTKVFGMEVPGTGAHYLITYSGEVKAGVADVSQIQVEVDEAGHVVTVTVPAVEVLSASIDPASVETYDQSFSVVNQIEVGEVTTFLAERETAADEAISKGLLDKAQGRLEDIVKKQANAVLGEQAAKYEVRVVIAPAPAE
ncbi:DUF4230 domain-containing protein [Actinomyces bouchesdurhonensis]|uniref:DUF4230 domain-containing protein n=1 Tax=Actinomyces bouchesdurhonensis TaxID=1852361 RepID=UPI00093ED4B7|nr:DUF4230 domain-containing protein [Actinomyces bouchesdurhonensis]